MRNVSVINPVAMTNTGDMHDVAIVDFMSVEKLCIVYPCIKSDFQVGIVGCIVHDFSMELNTGKLYRVCTLPLSVKISGTQRRTRDSLSWVYCTYCGWRKGTSQDELISNSEEIKPVAL